MVLVTNAGRMMPPTQTREAEVLASMVDDYRTFTIIKTLSPPQGEIFDFRVPVAARQGDSIEPGVGIRNLGEQSGTFWATVIDIDTGATLGSGSTTIAGGSTGWIYPSAFPMPPKTLNVRANIGHDTTIDDYMDKTIPLMEAKGTIIKYEAPASARPGDPLTISATVKNVGTDSGTFQVRVRDNDLNVDVDATGWFTMAKEAETTKTLSGTMPDRDWNLTLLLERVLPTGAVTVDDQKTFTAINIINLWTKIKAWWNGLSGVQKAIILTTSLGSVIIGGTALKRG